MFLYTATYQSPTLNFSLPIFAIDLGNAYKFANRVKLTLDQNCTMKLKLEPN